MAAFVTWGDNETTWRVVASLPAGLLEVTGVKAQGDWSGGRSRDDGSEEDVTARLYPFRAPQSAKYNSTAPTAPTATCRRSATLRRGSLTRIRRQLGERHSRLAERRGHDRLRATCECGTRPTRGVRRC